MTAGSSRTERAPGPGSFRCSEEGGASLAPEHGKGLLAVAGPGDLPSVSGIIMRYVPKSFCRKHQEAELGSAFT